MAKPFLKWVGGKSRLLPQFSGLFPEDFRNYYEPMLGGGAVFFWLSETIKNDVHLSDINKNLIYAYSSVRDHPEELIEQLRKIEKVYLSKNDRERKEFYYKARKRFNKLPADTLEKTKLLVFLNKTGYNGMYRENSDGEFNIPHGRHKKVQILNEENLINASRALKNVNLSNNTFEQAILSASKGDFVYFDPPYHPRNETASFTKYSESDFGVKDQERLKDIFIELDKKGCYVMLSNSHTKFIEGLYKDYRHEIVEASRAVNCKADGRGRVKELVILNY